MVQVTTTDSAQATERFLTSTHTGAMIIHSPGAIGATYIEGTFEQGLPHGTVQVEVPGKAPMIREFTAGEDRGRGKAENLSKVEFK